MINDKILDFLMKFFKGHWKPYSWIRRFFEGIQDHSRGTFQDIQKVNKLKNISKFRSKLIEFLKYFYFVDP